jgi:hypothetical protein
LVTLSALVSAVTAGAARRRQKEQVQRVAEESPSGRVAVRVTLPQ